VRILSVFSIGVYFNRFCGETAYIVHISYHSVATLHIVSRNVKWVHCHHGMARPRVAGRGDGLQIWRVAANILNKQSRTADSGWSSSLGVGLWGNNPSP
jgi:hypothetical protein